ncbi:helicase domain protein [Oceanithermus profundus DSM 14977]|uniref:Helicase domain protein n=1 Tax=Oceanithermus profundus (strain DSM 14977 / NBRC 100410 / VKM B-2274 / 506) TaxID=670487 RepID=E4U6D5_OCEP5|nr:DISARM system helicase DrmA [Oceanithermus profundus]ADR35555.1 helicase domain protein [Oceanithermus profundus DSM 14977]
MGFRKMLVEDLVRQVLGPLDGPEEKIDAELASPLNLYLTGVLEPPESWDRQGPADPDSEAVRLEGEQGTSEEDQEDGEVAPPPVPLPALHPASRPSVFGIAFELEVPDGKQPEIEVLLTWGRYLLHEGSGAGKVWQRYPNYRHIERLTLDQNRLFDAGDLQLHVRVKNAGGRVRAFIQVRVVVKEEGEIEERCVFQPSLRIRVLEGVLIPLGNANQAPVSEDEQAMLDFGYRNLPVLARGLLCSATWKEVDPEREAPGGEQWMATWADAYALSPDLLERFTAPDLRTEFIPMYALSAPDWTWVGGDPEPEFDPKTLSSSADPDRIAHHLEPLVRGFRDWIEKQESAARNLKGNAVKRIIKELHDTLKRMERGLELLHDEMDARMAFAFANRALWLQARWDSREFTWRPFQLAFLLAAIESAARPDSPDRDVCDVLWVPTGGGKTEAYLALVAFVLAYRRRIHGRNGKCGSGGGTAVISRYTLRLLTLQQFRRALKVITSCEYLRVLRDPGAGKPGWRPEGAPDEDFPWGTERFSAGIWVGGAITPNKLKGTWNNEAQRSIPGALDVLAGKASGGGEPAQVTGCPACGALLAVPSGGLGPGEHLLHLVVRREKGTEDGGPGEGWLLGNPDGFKASILDVTPLPSGFEILTVHIETDRALTRQDIDSWWKSGPAYAYDLAPFAASRPGYFPRYRRGKEGPQLEDFEIWCPSPTCPLGEIGEGGIWWETAPRDDLDFHVNGTTGSGGNPRLNGVGNVHPETGTPLRCVFRRVIDPWVAPNTNSLGAVRIPIPALTVDDQVYAHPPSLLVGTVDKFARMAYEPKTSHLFGKVNFYHPWSGYQGPATRQDNIYKLGDACEPLPPPELILQDELHLVEGPLGSLVGLYETAVENLIAEDFEGFQPKYVASSATIREAGSQVKAVFDRRIALFPPPGFDANDRFFVRGGEAHPLYESRPGQLYVGIAAPGAGTLKPIYRVWAVLLQAVWNGREDGDYKYFHTLVGYFNAIRELAGGRALTRQDIPEHLQFLEQLTSTKARPFYSESIEELSGRIDSTDLPDILDRLAGESERPDALLTTSMFGTGIDLPQLSLMVIHGQPKTTASYIQAAGRVGRNRAGLVVSLLRPSRPRDLSHYEFFVGYHRQVYRHVEPITVMPFAPAALHRAAGPVMVAMLRNGSNTAADWGPDSGATAIAASRSSAYLTAIVEALRGRGRRQPTARRPDSERVEELLNSGLDRWQQIAKRRQDLVYVEYGKAEKPVVLGDPLHRREGLPVVFENAPQSLRDIEETIGIEY